jgi:hypothetical protein
MGLVGTEKCGLRAIKAFRGIPLATRPFRKRERFLPRAGWWNREVISTCEIVPHIEKRKIR